MTPLIIVVGQTFSTGRGGAGNIRSPSRDINNPLSPDPAQGERELIREHVAASQEAPVGVPLPPHQAFSDLFPGTQHSTGRGGVGNIANRSRSRGPTVPAVAMVHSTGRGGAGNIIAGDGLITGVIDEEERKRHAPAEDAWYAVYLAVFCLERLIT